MQGRISGVLPLHRWHYYFTYPFPEQLTQLSLLYY